MKKIINGKRYDTETAEKVHTWDNGHYPGDFHMYEERLYRTKKGMFFLYKVGGAMSSMARSCGGNSYCGGADIEPLTDDEAEALERLFPERIEDA
jgi:hypothetical protein